MLEVSIVPVLKVACQGLLALPSFRRISDLAEEVDGKRPHIEALISTSENVLIRDLLNNEIGDQVITSARKKLAEIRNVYHEIAVALDERHTFCLKVPFSAYFTLWRTINFIKNGYMINRLVNVSAKILHENTNDRPPTKLLMQESTSFPDRLHVFGRASEVNDLTNVLVSTQAHKGTWNGDVISIVGMAGIGKSTVARLAFCERKVKKRFSKRIWVSVQFNFDLARIAREILLTHGVQVSSLDSVSLNFLLKLVDMCVQGEKTLLVLDDVGTIDESMWCQLKWALKSCHAGSRILVTTQNQDIAQLMGSCGDNLISLQPLPKQDCWSILSSTIVSQTDGETNGWLDEVERECEEACDGIPLLATTFGYSGRSKNVNTAAGWNAHFHRDIGSLSKGAVFRSLLLSYIKLSPIERSCLLSCSFFPKDFTMERDNVVQWWSTLVLGLKHSNKIENLEIEILSCFKKLVDRHWLQVKEKDEKGNARTCKLHKIVHDFLRFLFKDGCFVMDNSNELSRTQVDKLPNLSFMLLLKTSEERIPTLKTNNQHSVFILRSKTQAPLLCDTLIELTCLWRLYLQQCNIEKLPKAIGRLMLLRYLNLSDNPFKKLPNSFCKLINLQTLRMERCANLEQLPKEMGKLENLQHLYIEGCDSLQGLPKGIQRLIHLRTLDMFVVPSLPEDEENGEAFLMLDDLDQMKDLQRFTVQTYRCGNLEIADDPTLMVQLPNLSRLEVRGFKGTTVNLDQMDSLRSLKTIILESCQSWESLPSLGNFPSLESLLIKDMDRVEKVGFESLGVTGVDATSFPALKELQFKSLHGWKKWEWNTITGKEAGNHQKILPQLYSLQITDCSSLEALPNFLKEIGLQNLIIDGCQILKQRCQVGVGEDWHKISLIPNIIIDGETMILPEVQGGSSSSTTTLPSI